MASSMISGSFERYSSERGSLSEEVHSSDALFEGGDLGGDEKPVGLQERISSLWNEVTPQLMTLKDFVVAGTLASLAAYYLVSSVDAIPVVLIGISNTIRNLVTPLYAIALPVLAVLSITDFVEAVRAYNAGEIDLPEFLIQIFCTSAAIIGALWGVIDKLFLAPVIEAIPMLQLLNLIFIIWNIADLSQAVYRYVKLRKLNNALKDDEATAKDVHATALKLFLKEGETLETVNTKELRGRVKQEMSKKVEEIALTALNLASTTLIVVGMFVPSPASGALLAIGFGIKIGLCGYRLYKKGKSIQAERKTNLEEPAEGGEAAKPFASTPTFAAHRRAQKKDDEGDDEDRDSSLLKRSTDAPSRNWNWAAVAKGKDIDPEVSATADGWQKVDTHPLDEGDLIAVVEEAI